jgi:hypothetical protein
MFKAIPVILSMYFISGILGRAVDTLYEFLRQRKKLSFPSFEGRPSRHAKLNSIAHFQADASINSSKILGADTHEGDTLRWDRPTNSMVLLTSPVVIYCFSIGRAHDGRSRIGGLCQSRTVHRPTGIAGPPQCIVEAPISAAATARNPVVMRPEEGTVRKPELRLTDILSQGQRWDCSTPTAITRGTASPSDFPS